MIMLVLLLMTMIMLVPMRIHMLMLMRMNMLMMMLLSSLARLSLFSLFLFRTAQQILHKIPTQGISFLSISPNMASTAFRTHGVVSKGGPVGADAGLGSGTSLP